MPACRARAVQTRAIAPGTHALQLAAAEPARQWPALCCACACTQARPRARAHARMHSRSAPSGRGGRPCSWRAACPSCPCPPAGQQGGGAVAAVRAAWCDDVRAGRLVPPSWHCCAAAQPAHLALPCMLQLLALRRAWRSLLCMPRTHATHAARTSMVPVCRADSSGTKSRRLSRSSSCRGSGDVAGASHACHAAVAAPHGAASAALLCARVHARMRARAGAGLHGPPTCSFSEMPRTGPRWMRFMRCCGAGGEAHGSVHGACGASPMWAAGGWCAVCCAAGLPCCSFASAHGGEASNLVAQALGLDDGDFRAHALVRVKVQGQAVVVLLDDDLQPAGGGQGGGHAGRGPMQGGLHACMRAWASSPNTQPSHAPGTPS